MEDLEGTNIDYNSEEDNNAIPNDVFEELNSLTGRNIQCVSETKKINKVHVMKKNDKIYMIENGIERNIQIPDKKKKATDTKNKDDMNPFKIPPINDKTKNNITLKKINMEGEDNKKIIRVNPFGNKKLVDEETKLVRVVPEKKKKDNDLIDLEKGNKNLVLDNKEKDLNDQDTIEVDFKNQIKGIESLLPNDNTISLNLNQKLEIWYRLEEIIGKDNPEVPIAKLIDFFPNYFSCDENDMEKQSNKRKGVYQIKKSFLENKIDNPSLKEDQLFGEMKNTIVNLLLKKFIGDGDKFNIVTRREEQKNEEIEKTSEEDEIIKGSSSESDSEYSKAFQDVNDTIFNKKDIKNNKENLDSKKNQNKAFLDTMKQLKKNTNLYLSDLDENKEATNINKKKNKKKTKKNKKNKQNNQNNIIQVDGNNQDENKGKNAKKRELKRKQKAEESKQEIKMKNIKDKNEPSNELTEDEVHDIMKRNIEPQTEASIMEMSLNTNEIEINNAEDSNKPNQKPIVEEVKAEVAIDVEENDGSRKKNKKLKKKYEDERELTPKEWIYWKNHYENESNSEAESEDYSDADDEKENEEERHTEAVEVDDSKRPDMQLSKKKREIYKSMLGAMKSKNKRIKMNSINNVEKFDKEDERILNKSEKKFKLLIKRNRFREGFNAIGRKVLNEREVTEDFKFSKRSSVYAQAATEHFGIFLFSSLNLMTLITHESYANLQHLMLFKLLFAEIANFVPADTFNKIILNAPNEEIEEAKTFIKNGKEKKMKSNETYRNKVKAREEEQRKATEEAKLKALNDRQVDEGKEKLDKAAELEDSKKEGGDKS